MKIRGSNKGLSTAIAVVIAIVVLLIIALAIIGVSTGALNRLSDVITHTPKGDQLTSSICESQISESQCNLYPSVCEWDESEKRCVPKE